MADERLHAQVLVDLGGKAAVARALGLDPKVVTKWHVRGIPAIYWHRVADLAANAGLPVTVQSLAQSKPSTREAA